MKFYKLAGFLLISQAAHAVTFCLDFSVQDRTRAVIGKARCGIDQPTTLASPMGTWTCVFKDGDSPQTKNFLATWITDAKPDQPAVISYSVNPGGEIGDFLFKGMGLQIKTGVTLPIVLGETPSSKYKNLMLMDSNWNSLDFNVVSAKYGPCE